MTRRQSATTDAFTRTAIGSDQDLVWSDDAPYLTCERQWEVIGHGRGYVMRLVQVPIMFEFLHVRRERGELLGQLRVLTDLPGTRAYEGGLGAPGTVNLTSPTQRKARASHLGRSVARAPHRLVAAARGICDPRAHGRGRW